MLYPALYAWFFSVGLCDKYLVTLLQLLQSLAIDVTTRRTLGKCIAVRVGEVMTLLKSIGVEISLTRSDVEIDLLRSDARRSQQMFLSCKSTDATLRHSTKGLGGNTQTQRWIILKQAVVEDEIIATIRAGEQHNSMTKYMNMCTCKTTCSTLCVSCYMYIPVPYTCTIHIIEYLLYSIYTQCCRVSSSRISITRQLS